MVALDPLALGVAALAIAALAALSGGVVSIRRRGGAVARLAKGQVAPLAPASLLDPDQHRPGFVVRALGRIGVLARPFRSDEFARLRTRLQQGGLRSDGALSVFLGAKVGLAAALVTAFLWANSRRADRIEPAPLIAIVACVLGYYFPDLWLASRTRRRQTAIERGLPDALDLLVTCVEAGLGLDAALQRVADEVRLAWPEISGELRTTFLEVNAGIPRIEAFRRLAHRTGVADLKSLSATLAQTEIFGTSVALALRIQAEGIRIRRMQRAEERAAYVGVKMTFPLVFCILPSLAVIAAGPAFLRVAATLLPILARKP